jgi:hypothetical protein
MLSPPEEPLDFRGKSLTPQSPKPLRFPSPSTIPILERQMDPSMNATVTEDPAIVHLATHPVVDSGIQEGNNSDGGPGFIIDTTGEEPMPFTMQSMEQNPLASSDQTPHEMLSAETKSDPNTFAPSDSTPIAILQVSQQTSNDTNTSQPTQTSETAVSFVNNPALAAGGVDFAALLSQLSPQIQSLTQTQSAPGIPLETSTSTTPSLASTSLNSTLPPRPQGQGNEGIDSVPYIPQNPLPAPILTAGANGLPPPPSATFQQPPITSYPLPSPPVARPATDEDGPFPPELERPYEDFLQDERQNVTDAKWEKFPEGSRLFIGTA